MGAFVALLLVVGLPFAIIGSAIGSNKGHAGAGFVLGLLFGPIGLIIVAVIPATPEAEAVRSAQVAAATQVLAGQRLRHCPWCAEVIQPAAIICKHCGRDVPVSEPHGDTAKSAERHDLKVCPSCGRAAVTFSGVCGACGRASA